MDQNDSIARLLRLKRYEQPPEGYFDDFLSEFQLRQRAEVIHRPFLSIAWDRFCSFLTPPPIPRLAFAGSFAAAVIATALVFNWSDSEADFASGASSIDLATSAPFRIDADKPLVLPSQQARTVQYVLPARPVSYGAIRSF
jgi:hypothetical protein